jgi:hypothetical protein
MTLISLTMAPLLPDPLARQAMPAQLLSKL